MFKFLVGNLLTFENLTQLTGTTGYHFANPPIKGDLLATITKKSQWIWVPPPEDGTSPEKVIMTATFPSYRNNKPAFAEVVLASDGAQDATLLVNGVEVGRTPAPTALKSGVLSKRGAQVTSTRLCFELNEQGNTVDIATAGSGYGVLLGMKVTGRDGIWVVQSTGDGWTYSAATEGSEIPANSGAPVQLLGRPSTLAPPVKPSNTPNGVPCEKHFAHLLPPTCETMKSVVGFEPAKWIWTKEMSKWSTTAMTRTFRRTFVPPPGKIPAFASGIMSGDDTVQFYVNSKLVASIESWGVVRRFQLSFPETRAENADSPIVLSARAYNMGGAGGFVSHTIITYTDGTSESIVTDNSWKTIEGNAGPNTFTSTTFKEDATWVSAYEIAAYPWDKVWQTLSIPGPSPGAACVAIPTEA